jgi:hypothetical protein
MVTHILAGFASAADASAVSASAACLFSSALSLSSNIFPRGIDRGTDQLQVNPKPVFPSMLFPAESVIL